MINPTLTITYPPLYNQRAGQIWEAISNHVDVAGKTILDIGCGGGDLIWRALGHGSGFVTAVDNDLGMILLARGRYRRFLKNNAPVHYLDRCRIIHFDFCRYLDGVDRLTKADLVICNSMLPYLPQAATLEGFSGTLLPVLARLGNQCVIECQYRGDGPGPSYLTGDDSMTQALRQVWGNVQKIGETIADKPPGTFKRSLWLVAEPLEK